MQKTARKFTYHTKHENCVNLTSSNISASRISAPSKNKNLNNQLNSIALHKYWSAIAALPCGDKANMLPHNSNTNTKFKLKTSFTTDVGKYSAYFETFATNMHKYEYLLTTARGTTQTQARETSYAQHKKSPDTQYLQ